MKAWESALVAPDTPLREAIAAIDRARSRLALVVDESRRLLGTLSDGDVRRALLRGVSLADPVSKAMFTKPSTVRSGTSRQAVLALMRQRSLLQVPLVDAEGAVVGLEVIDDYLAAPVRDNPVVVMAGGLGSRLAELTRETPKPMLPVGDRPLLETLIRSYADQGFRRFYIAVNYKAEQIEAHFGDGSRFGVHIDYLRERERLGTAGALSLLPERPVLPLVVTNADLLTNEDYGSMVDGHDGAGAHATMAVREYEMQVPFGVVHERDGRIEAIEEKPQQRYTVSAGIYVLAPQVLDLVPDERYFDMPALFEEVMRRGLLARTHRIDGYWLDVGRLPDYERATTDFHKVFG